MSLKCRVLHGTPCYVSRLNLQEPERMVFAKKHGIANHCLHGTRLDDRVSKKKIE